MRGKLISLQGFIPLTVPRRLRGGSLSPTFGNMPRWERQAPIRRRYGSQQAANCLSMCAMCVNVLHSPVYLAAFQPTFGVGLFNMFSPFIIPIIKTIHGLELLPASYRPPGKKERFFLSDALLGDVQVLGTVQYLVSPLL